MDRLFAPLPVERKGSGSYGCPVCLQTRPYSLFWIYFYVHTIGKQNEYRKLRLTPLKCTWFNKPFLCSCINIPSSLRIAFYIPHTVTQKNIVEKLNPTAEIVFSKVKKI